MPNFPPQPIEDSPVGNAWQSVCWELCVLWTAPELVC